LVRHCVVYNDVIGIYTYTGGCAFSVDASFVFTSSTDAAGEIQERVLLNVLTILCLINKVPFTGKWEGHLTATSDKTGKDLDCRNGISQKLREKLQRTVMPVHFVNGFGLKNGSIDLSRCYYDKQQFRVNMIQ